jgi:hypothetical protein
MLRLFLSLFDAEVRAPFLDIAVHVVEAPEVRLLHADRMRLSFTVPTDPGIVARVMGLVLALRVLPPGLLRLPKLDRRRELARLSCLPRELLAELDGLVPVDALHGIPRALEATGVGSRQLLILFLRYRVDAEVEGGVYGYFYGCLKSPSNLGIARQELAGRDERQLHRHVAVERERDFHILDARAFGVVGHRLLAVPQRVSGVDLP